MSNLSLKCKCGFQFSGPGEYRNCDAFVTRNGDSGVICPDCGRQYINGIEVKVFWSDKEKKFIAEMKQKSNESSWNQ